MNRITAPITYFSKSKKLPRVLLAVLKSDNFIKDQNWILYIPDGYNSIEKELKTLQPQGKYIYGVNGCDRIVSKTGLWSLMLKHYGREQAKYIMPESFDLSDLGQMLLFHQQFKPNVFYMLKKNVQRKKGLLLTQKLDEILYGRNDGFRLVQKYIDNVYLINQRKVNLRMYILIKVDPEVKMYVYQEGKCIYTNKDYDPSSTDVEANITSVNLDTSIYDRNPYSLQELRAQTGDLLFDNIDQMLKKLLVVIKDAIYQSDNLNNTICFQLFGIDIIFDNHMHPFLLEFNKGPDMNLRHPNDVDLKWQLQRDVFVCAGLINGTSAFREVQL